MQSRPLEKVTLNLFEGDYARVQAVAGKAGASLVVRSLVAAFLEKIDAGMKPAQAAVEEAQIDV